jgi:acetyl esterase/lipase
MSLSKYSPTALFCGCVALHLVLNARSFNLLDNLTLTLHRNLTVKFQRHLRDSGVVRNIADTATAAIALILGLSRPHLIKSFINLRGNIQTLSYGSSPFQFLEIMWSSNDLYMKESLATKTGKCLVFVHGGAWGSGQVWHYRLIAEGLRKVLGASSVILVGYPVFPFTNIQQQVECITNALKFISDKNGPVQCTFGERNDGGGGPLILAGHSSGANICALALLNALGEKEDGRTNAFSKVEAFVGLAGVYDIEKHYTFEAARGVHEVSPMAAAAGGPDGFAACSPTLLLRQLIKAQQIDKDAIRQDIVMAVDCVLVHGTEDTTVPHSSSEEFAQELRALGFNTTTNYVAVRFYSSF